MALELDPRFTFEAFVVGPANRLAVAAARRVADSPGASYNPLFIYSASGLGKTHLLGAIGNHVEGIHAAEVVYDTTEHLMEELSAAVEAGEQDAFRHRLRGTGLLLLDDVQFLAGRRQELEELLRAWDALAGRGAQVVLTSDRPPQEIDELDDRLLSRLSGGLIVDVGTPDYETRIAIARRKAEERGITLVPDVFRALARIAFTNVRELQGALNRLIAVQELEERTVTPEEVTELLGAAAERGRDEFGEFLSDITGTVTAVVEDADRQIADAILEWEGEGYRTRRLESALAGTITAQQARTLVSRFERDVARLRQIAAEIRELDRDARELTHDVLRDP
ncbi:MAG: DnaA ATPase domain-containing protein, partial [Gemmatimonadota bacterium]